MTPKGQNWPARSSEQCDYSEKVVVLPICWHVTTLERLSRIVDLQVLRAHRQVLLVSLVLEIEKLSTLRLSIEDEPVFANDALRNARTCKHLDVLVGLLEDFTIAMKRLD